MRERFRLLDNKSKAVPNGDIPVGYKQTEAGLIPEDWEVRKLREISPSQSVGLVINPSSYYSENGTVPMLVGSHVSENRISWISANKITEDSNVKLPASRLNAGDLVTVRVGEPGITAVIPKELDRANCASMMITRKGKNFDSFWLCYLMNSQIGKSRIEGVQYGTAQKQFNIVDAVDFIFPFPSKPEQTAIANVLSDTDALIIELEKLIAKKQYIKIATMQQLLTGRTRLSQFAKHPNGCIKGYKFSELGLIPDDWDVYTFNDLIEFCSSGATPYRGNKSFYTGRNKWITSGELNYCVINDTLEKISDEAVRHSNLKIHPAGTFLMAITGLEAAGTRGACGIVGQPAATNQSCMAIYPNEKLLSAYLYHWYVYNGEALAFKYCQGTKQLSYTAGLLRTIPLYIPNIVEEQTAIATILSDMDAELTALERKLAKFRDIKQGMMQQLLTGRIRLPLEQQP